MSLQIEPPLYMIGMKIACWRCQARMAVIAFLAPHVANADGQVCVLGHIQNMPPDVMAFVQHRVPTFQLRSSKMAGSRYFANTCPKCRVISGDFFLHAEPGAPFFPTSAEEAKLLYIRQAVSKEGVFQEGKVVFTIINIIA